MKHKKVKKIISSRKKKTSSHLLVGYTIIFLGGIVLFVVGMISFSWVQSTHVLGASTFLAEGSQSGPGGGDNSGSGNSGSGETHEVMPPENQGNPTENTTAPVTNEEHSQTVSGDTPVTCTGPDGKKFQTSALVCQHLNQSWHHPVRFASESGTPPPPRTSGAFGTNERHMGTRPPKPGHEIGEDNELRVEQNGDEEFMVKQGSIGARSKFPLSLNPTTRQLTVTTPNGTKDVAVLPDQAVKNLLDKKIITSLHDTILGASSSVSLEVKNSNPVFVITGDSKQHFLGFIPVTIHKSVDVSAQTGDVTGQNETFGQRFLDFFSF